MVDVIDAKITWNYLNLAYMLIFLRNSCMPIPLCSYISIQYEAGAVFEKKAKCISSLTICLYYYLI